MAYDVTLQIPAISCHHCVATIKRETSDVPGVLGVEADAEARTATYKLENAAALPKVKEVLAEIGYPAAG